MATAETAVSVVSVSQLATVLDFEMLSSEFLRPTLLPARPSAPMPLTS
jgi:hypothetical protein